LLSVDASEILPITDFASSNGVHRSGFKEVFDILVNIGSINVLSITGE